MTVTRRDQGLAAGLAATLVAIATVASGAPAGSKVAPAETPHLRTHGGRAYLDVCWAAPQLGSVYPIPWLAPKPEDWIPEVKAWVREIVESEWNVRTPVQFTGWGECADSPAKVTLVIADSNVRLPTGPNAVSAVTLPGPPARGPIVYLSLGFGVETLYESVVRLGQTTIVTEALVPNSHLGYPYLRLQAACDQTSIGPWHPRSSNMFRDANIRNPQALSDFRKSVRRCVEAITMHEFGHLAGLGHLVEKDLRREDRVDCLYKLASINPILFRAVVAGRRPESGIPVRDRESVMSECRRRMDSTLAESDLDLIWSAYDPSRRGDVR